MTALRNALTAEELAEQANRGEPERGRWSQSEQLIALLADRLGALHHAYVSTHSQRKQKAPEPIRRPGAKTARSKQAPTQEQNETLFRLINGGAV